MNVKMSERTDSKAPDGMRIYAVGDIHGRLDLLDKMLAAIALDRSERESVKTVLVFLGDYVDRGPDSKGVAGRLISGLPADVTPVFLKGNHEDLLLTFLDRPWFGLNWLHNGGDMALLSYGVDVKAVQNAYWRGEEGLIEANAVFRSLLPEDHLRFFRSLKVSYRAGDYFFVHAGVKPGVPLDRQSENDMIWIRDVFLGYAHDFGAVVVHGHTPVRVPENRHNRIGIDTLAFQSGILTAVGLEGTERWFLTAR